MGFVSQCTRCGDFLPDTADTCPKCPPVGGHGGAPFRRQPEPTTEDRVRIERVRGKLWEMAEYEKRRFPGLEGIVTASLRVAVEDFDLLADRLTELERENAELRKDRERQVNLLLDERGALRARLVVADALAEALHGFVYATYSQRPSHPGLSCMESSTFMRLHTAAREALTAYQSTKKPTVNLGRCYPGDRPDE